MKTFLTEGTTQVRQARPPDAAVMFELIEKNRSRLALVFPWALQIKSASQQADFYQQAQKLWNSRSEYHYVISFEGNDVGAISVHSINWEQNEAQFGYWIDEDFEGKGIVSTAVRLLETGLQTLGLRRFVIRFHDFNVKSKRVAEKLGYQAEQVPGQASSPQTYIKLY